MEGLLSIWGISIIFIVIIFLLIFIVEIIREKHEKNKYYSSTYKDISHNNYEDVMEDKGIKGEYDTFVELENLTIEKELFTNLVMPRNEKNTEIDIVMATRKGIFVFECKSRSGRITGDENEKFWNQHVNHRVEHELYNPIWQNNFHKNAIRDNLNLRKGIKLYSYIVFDDDCELDIEYTKKYVSILRLCQVRNEVHEHYSTINYCMSKKEFEKIKLMLGGYSCN